VGRRRLAIGVGVHGVGGKGRDAEGSGSGPGISEASAARLPAAALAALCMDCHIGGMADGPITGATCQ